MLPPVIDLEWAPGRATRLRCCGEGDTVLILAHGAGTSQDHPSMELLRTALAGEQLQVVTFDYPYRAEGRKPPDRMPTLLECHRQVVEWVRDRTNSLPVLAGRSMGGRVGTLLAAGGEKVRAAVCYAYPLHPAGKPDRLRIEHLPEVPVPMLFVQGTRDALSRPDLFDRHVRSLPGARVVDLEDADHSFRVRGREAADVAATVASATRRFLDSLPAPI